MTAALTSRRGHHVLRELIRLDGRPQARIAEAAGIDPTILGALVYGALDFERREMVALGRVFTVPPSTFFDREVL